MTDLTKLEVRAHSALNLPAFPVNLRLIRDTVFHLLGEIGRYGFFDEYTDHSSQHILDMLETAEWMIPDETKQILTEGDYLFIVLSIYLHDIGLLISRDEYKRRNTNPEFVRFKASPPIPADKFIEFLARLAKLPLEESERILYQEFVRYSHGQRVRAWVEGYVLDDNDASLEIRAGIGNLLTHLDPTVRRDLALVCESHTKNDIDDVKKYKTSQPYGGSAQEAVNLQYVAAILRSVDLLQITRGRAPSILYQIINPTDPISQVEWQKQKAVRNVRPAEMLLDTIEVHAQYQQSDGFFGLTSYLAYAEKELKATNVAITSSEIFLKRPPKFPWKRIDAGGVEAVGFLTESFEFSLDQTKILDLLTGHTLYNDTTVVLRELTQNALDAVRLQAEIDQTPSTESGRVKIRWESEAGVLTVWDNGTGMSQLTIENHLLKVGSSRYQSQKFKDQFPSFSSISRFGIGVLSAFMISDDVQITTCSPDDEKARKVELRSVHGKYLIKLLDKVADREEIGVFPHGTSVRLVLRPSASIGDILRIARLWLLFPRCEVTVIVDDKEPYKVGFSSPKEAIETYIENSFKRRDRFRREITVRQVSENGITLAFAVSRSEIFRDWSFVEVPRERRASQEDEDLAPIATCIEGVGVEFATPGFRGRGILAVANATGPSAPKTNVARSALEDTAEHREMLSTIYKLYTQHVSMEVARLAESEGFSLTRAVGEAPFIASSLVSQTMPISRPGLMTAAMSEAPLVLVESGAERSNISYSALIRLGQFWTVESPLSRSIETFIKEAPTDVTANLLLNTLGNGSSNYPQPNTVCNYSSSNYLDRLIRDDFEVELIIASRERRRIDLRWSKKQRKPKWISSTEVFKEASQRDNRFWILLSECRSKSNQVRPAEGLNVPLEGVSFEGLDAEGGCISNRERYLKPGEPLTEFLLTLREADDGDAYKILCSYLALVETVISFGWTWEVITADVLERGIDPTIFAAMKPYFGELSTFVEAIRSSNQRMFNPFAWDRGETR